MKNEMDNEMTVSCVVWVIKFEILMRNVLFKHFRESLHQDFRKRLLIDSEKI